MPVSIAQLSAEHHHDGFGISRPSPRLSWRFGSSTVRGWTQASYDITISRPGKADETYHVDSADSVLVPWPSSPLSSREIAHVQVRSTGKDGSATDWARLTVEAALLERSDWAAKLISAPQQAIDQPKRPFRLRKKFTCPHGPARLYATAHGLYQVEINGKSVGDQVLAPGWQSYKHRLHYQVYDITSLLKEGENAIGVTVGEGWYAGRIGRPGVPNIWGNRLGFLGQLEVGGKVVCATDSSWEYLDGPIIDSEIYNGEVIDTSLIDLNWSTTSQSGSAKCKVEELSFPSAELISPDVAPVRRVIEIKPKKLITTPKGKKVLDFGQNLVGWLRIEKDIPGKKGDELLIRHAEVMEHEELGTRPLRTAKARDIVKLGGPTKGYEPSFTFHGFRYAEITGYDALTLDDFTAIMISSDLRRTGTFECSHPLITKLHENTVWSMQGNFVSIPTDCPQRDERLGWTGDIQVFAPTANYLFDTAAFLGTWLRDVEADQRDADGVVPIIVPVVPMGTDNKRQYRPMAVWADCAIITPWDLYNAFGDKATLEVQWESMRLWLDKGVPRDERGFYATTTPQYGDWLDPRSPPQLPGHTPTDNYLVANAYLVYVTNLTAQIAKLIGKSDEADSYSSQASKLLKTFQDEYITATGRLVSDTQTGYALALRFGLIPEKHIGRAKERLDYLTRWESFKITTGFAGTPIILDVLASHGMLNLAYGMLQERDDPSWLYPVTMGATTIWERWNSMLPDGSINPGQMTSFNHYALGSVCAFLHGVVGGLSATSPGWKTALVHPQPGGSVTHASTSFDSPYGLYSVEWKREGSKMVTKVRVPPNGEARVVLDGVDETIASGEYSFETKWMEDPEWPPKHIQGPQGLEVAPQFVM
ncbi:bacterial alpha-L-rhamnosidase-domain-containing protein [Xylogone sp. PMI_703]|nr:bacterial alpha-L-rhamnosidase-domain-containing protein [Xylogone sp. PMI_703]